MNETMTCTSCQKEIPIGCSFCPYCGHTVEGADFDPEGSTTVLGSFNPFTDPVPSNDAAPAQEALGEGEWICPTCNNKNNSRFCIFCGTKSPLEDVPVVDVAQAAPVFAQMPPQQPEMPDRCPPQNGEPAGAFVPPQEIPAQDAAPVNMPPQPMAQTDMPMNMPPQMMAPVKQLKTNRGLAKFILLSIITFGIYALVVMTGLSDDINIIASRYDGKKTMNFLLVSLILTPVTCGIFALVWYHQLSARIGAELERRGIDYSFGAKDFWLWSFLGSMIIVGPFIYTHKLFKAMNLLSENYNING